MLGPVTISSIGNPATGPPDPSTAWTMSVCCPPTGIGAGAAGLSTSDPAGAMPCPSTVMVNDNGSPRPSA